MMQSDYARFGVLRSLTAALGLAVSSSAFGAIKYVNHLAPAGGNGNSWVSAYKHLQDAIAAAGQQDQIWVAKGTYFPDLGNGLTPGDTNTAFMVKFNVKMYGGFAGNETNLAQRNPEVNETILSGDIGVPGNQADNCVRVVRLDGGPPIELNVLDGFTITEGNAINGGGGIRRENGGATIVNCLITANHSASNGGGVWSNGPVNLINCSFIGNTCGDRGAGAYLSQGTPVNCYFSGNSAGRGGGLFCNGNEGATDCIFEGNSANEGGGVASLGNVKLLRCSFIGNDSVNDGGAFYAFGNSANTYMIDCDFIGNSAGASAGGVSNVRGGFSRYFGCRFIDNDGTSGGGLFDGSLCLVTNCLFNGNSVFGNHGAIFNYGAPLTIANCTIVNNESIIGTGGVRSQFAMTVSNSILWNNSTSDVVDQASQLSSAAAIAINHSCISGWNGSLGGAGNSGADPLFANELGVDEIEGTEDDDFTLLSGSPAIDAGNNASVPADQFDADGDFNTSEPLPVDMLGNARFVDDVSTPDGGAGTAPLVDMGSIETPSKVLPPGTYVGPSGGSWFVASHWAGNVIPNASTNVAVKGEVTVDQPGAIANLITVHDGGVLTVTTGTLQMSSILLELGSTLQLDDPSASVQTAEVTAIVGSTVQWNSGTFRLLSGGTWNNFSAPLTFGCAGASSFIVEANSVYTGGELSVCQFGTLTGDGLIDGPVTNGGIVAPGQPIGTLVIDGSYIQTEQGTLAIDLGGYLPGAGYDQLLIEGVVSTTLLAGSLDLSLTQDFQPELAGDQRLLITESGFSGTFSNKDLPKVSGGFLLDLNYPVTTPDGCCSSIQLLTTLEGTGARLYVNAAAGAGGNAQSWETASNDLRAALDLAALFPEAVEEIWVASGTYTPDRGTGNRTGTFELLQGWSMYGGFAGNETELSQRDFVNNVVILSGDLNSDDGALGTFQNYADNSYHVVRTVCNNCGDPPLLDGFTIIGGNASVPNNVTHGVGGGLHANADGAVVANCRFLYNSASLHGGGMADSGFHTVTTNCEFIGNRTDNQAAALRAGLGTPEINNCIFDSNNASGSGHTCVLVTAVSAAAIQNCLFTNNNGPATVRVEGNTFFNVLFENCDFIANSSDAALELRADSVVTVASCLFESNAGVAVHNVGALTILDSQFLGNLGGAVGSSGAHGVVNLTIVNSQFNENLTSDGAGFGAGVLVDSGAAELTGCSFTANHAAEQGGALYVRDAVATLAGCTFSDNTARQGSSVYNWLRGEIRGDLTTLGLDGLHNTGRLAPGLPGEPESFTIGGDFRQENIVDPEHFNGQFLSMISIDLGGVIAGEGHDSMEIGGTVFLEGGALEVQVSETYSPELGQTFSVLNASAVSGGFDIATMPGLDGGRFIDVVYGPTSVSLSIEKLKALLAFGIPGDLFLDSTPSQASLADLDDDGDLDLIVLLPNPTAGLNGHVAVLRNAGLDGKGAWMGFEQTLQLEEVGINPQSLSLSHLNGDDLIDAVVGNEGSSNVTVLANSGVAADIFQTGINYAVGANPMSIDAGAAIGDLANDIIVGCAELRRVWRLANNGSGGFAVAETFDGARAPQAVRLTDLDQDGDLDLVVARRDRQDTGQPTTIEYRLFDSSSGSFGDPATQIAGFGTTQMIAVDLNSDDFPDLMTTDESGGTFTILLNEFAFGGSLTASLVPIGQQPRSLTASDFDSDGDLDLAAIVSASGTPLLRIIRNDLNGGAQLILATAVDVGPGGEPLLLLAGDVDLDGSSDLLAATAVSSPLAGSNAVNMQTYLNETQTSLCDGDITDDGAVDVDDLLAVINSWGPCDPGECDADIAPQTPDGVINVDDLLAVINNWGSCL